MKKQPTSHSEQNVQAAALARGLLESVLIPARRLVDHPHYGEWARNLIAEFEAEKANLQRFADKHRN